MDITQQILFNNFWKMYMGDSTKSTQGQQRSIQDSIGQPVGTNLQNPYPERKMQTLAGFGTVLPYTQPSYPGVEKTANQFTGGIL